MTQDTAGTHTTRLRAWRLANDLSLEEVSGLSGISRPMLSRVERGQRELAPLTKVRLARALGVPVRELFDVADLAEA
jgi:transcriptional regulator with XRE-family HTH domain